MMISLSRESVIAAVVIGCVDCVCSHACMFLHVCLFVRVTVCKRQSERCAVSCQSLLAGVDVFVSACRSPSLSAHPH